MKASQVTRRALHKNKHGNRCNHELLESFPIGNFVFRIYLGKKCQFCNTAHDIHDILLIFTKTLNTTLEYTVDFTQSLQYWLVKLKSNLNLQQIKLYHSNKQIVVYRTQFPFSWNK